MQERTEAKLPTKYGDFRIVVWPEAQGREPVAIVTPTLDTTQPVLVRIHSECLTGDVFGSLRCDCGPQRDEALKQIAESKNGIFIYLRQEGRGLGLFGKIQSYKLQEEGVDTHEASIRLGHLPDEREYSWAKKILTELGVKNIKLLSNNPAKLSEIFNAGFEVEKVPLVMQPTEHSAEYFKVKRKKFKHTFGEPDTSHFFSITYTDYSVDIDPLLTFLRGVRKHPLLKFHIGVYVSGELLKDEGAKTDLQVLFNTIAREPDVFPIAHLSFKDSLDPKKDIHTLKQTFPELQYMVPNDLADTEDFIEILELAAKEFKLIVSLSDKTFPHIHDERFRALLSPQSFILLDNSKGTGKTEGYENYQEKIKACLEYGLNNIVLAGGFGPGRLETYFKLCNYYKIDFSIDAESQLHTDGKLDNEKAIQYFSELLHL